MGLIGDGLWLQGPFRLSAMLFVQHCSLKHSRRLVGTNKNENNA